MTAVLPTMIYRTSVLLLFIVLSTACQYFQPLPEGISFRGEEFPAPEVELLTDLTYLDSSGERQVKQEIFNEIFTMIATAKRFILIDMFLYNDFQGPRPETTRALSAELTQALLTQKRKHPAMRIIVITDPINTVYAGQPSKQLQQLREAGIEVVMTKLEKLRDSNPLYSFFWRLFIQPFGNDPGHALPNPFGQGRVSVRSYLSLLNFKANHRKVVIVDSGDHLRGLVTSANPHDASSAHGNVAITFSGRAVNDLLTSENAVLALSDAGQADNIIEPNRSAAQVTVQVLTEKKIKTAVLQCLISASQGDRIDVAMFYLADRAIITALKQAHTRGTTIRVLLDPNKDAFGHEKNGIPGRPVASELHDSGIAVRWCDTHGEQCHAKMLLANYGDGNSVLIAGSANFTRRNLDDFNLETDVAVRGSRQARIFRQTQDYFDLLWFNQAGRHFSADYAKFKDETLPKWWLYRLMEASGLSTF